MKRIHISSRSGAATTVDLYITNSEFTEDGCKIIGNCQYGFPMTIQYDYSNPSHRIEIKYLATIIGFQGIRPDLWVGLDPTPKGLVVRFQKRGDLWTVIGAPNDPGKPEDDDDDLFGTSVRRVKVKGPDEIRFFPP